MKKVMVIGPSGAGKSEFSRKLKNKLNLPLYHLDNIFWNEDKTHISREEFDIKLNEILVKNEWIIDGDYSRTYVPRMEASDTIIFLNYPLDLCLSGVESRIGKKRLDIPWIEDEFSQEFKDWILNWFDKTLPILDELLDKNKDKKDIIIFTNREEANIWLDKLSIA